MDKFSEIEKALPAKEVIGSPGQRADFSAGLGSDSEVDGLEPLDAAKSNDSGYRGDSPTHAGWISGGRGIKAVVNEEQAEHLRDATVADARDTPTPDPSTTVGTRIAHEQRLQPPNPANTAPVAENVASHYAELHVHSNYSFQEGASESWDLLLTPKQLGLHALAITNDRWCYLCKFNYIH